MEAKFTKSTDSEEEIQLESKLIYADWSRNNVMPGRKAEVEVATCFVGNGASIKIKGESSGGKSLGKLKGKIRNNRFTGLLDIPGDVRIGETVTFEVELSDNSLSGESAAIPVIPPVVVSNLSWGSEEARRGDILTLTADVEGARDETEVVVTILEFDQDGANDKITELTGVVREEKIEVSWEYEYHEDTDELPTQQELDDYGGNYNPPEYFFTVGIEGETFGKSQESGILNFKDFAEIVLLDAAGNPVPDEDYKLTLADGSERTGTLDGDGKAIEEDIPPGPYRVEFPNQAGFGRSASRADSPNSERTRSGGDRSSDTQSNSGGSR